MHKAKQLYKSLRDQEVKAKETSFYNYHAKLIQKLWRGYHSRRTVFDYYARRKYLATLNDKNEAVKVQMEEYLKSSLLEERKRKEEAARAEFNEICKKVHHLSSTSAIPGIYNSPYIGVGMKPQAFNIDIETHLKTSFKSVYQWKAPSKDVISKYKR